MKRFLNYDVSHIAEIRKKIILEGKHSPKFKIVPKRYFKSDPKKYLELDNIENSGAINKYDAQVLYSIASYFQPNVIFECGTWFGTSAYIMALALSENSRVYTCDKQDRFVADHPKVKYHNIASNILLKILKKKGVSFDIAFYDGRLEDGDAKRISRHCKSKVFITHDYKGKEKGYRNIKAMRKYWPDAELIEPIEGSSVAVLWNK